MTRHCSRAATLVGERITQLIEWLERSGAEVEAPLLRTLRSALGELPSGADLTALCPNGYAGMVSGSGG